MFYPLAPLVNLMPVHNITYRTIHSAVLHRNLRDECAFFVLHSTPNVNVLPRYGDAITEIHIHSNCDMNVLIIININTPMIIPVSLVKGANRVPGIGRAYPLFGMLSSYNIITFDIINNNNRSSARNVVVGIDFVCCIVPHHVRDKWIMTSMGKKVYVNNLLGVIIYHQGYAVFYKYTRITGQLNDIRAVTYTIVMAQCIYKLRYHKRMMAAFTVQHHVLPLIYKPHGRLCTMLYYKSCEVIAELQYHYINDN